MHSLLPWASFGSGPSCLQHAPQHIGLARNLSALISSTVDLAMKGMVSFRLRLCARVSTAGGRAAHVTPALSADPDRLGSGSGNAGRCGQKKCYNSRRHVVPNASSHRRIDRHTPERPVSALSKIKTWRVLASSCRACDGASKGRKWLELPVLSSCLHTAGQRRSHGAPRLTTTAGQPRFPVARATLPTSRLQPY